MAETLPDPLVPAEVDLRGLEWMPYYGNRLFGSDFDAHADDTAFRAGHQLWWASWNQVPAASLPNDDVALCRLAGLGRDARTWKRIKDAATRGFILCSDGRLYHRTLSQWAVQAWDRRRRDRDRKAKWRASQEQPRPAPKDKPVTPAVTPSVPVSGTAERRGEERTGEEIKKEPATPSVAVAPPPAADPLDIPDFLDKRPKATAEPELLPPEQPTDVKAIIFGAGLRWLRKACGDATESSCRSFLGQLIAQHGEAQTAACLISAEKTNPVDPRAWMKRNIGGPNGQQPRNPRSVQHGGESPTAVGVAAAFARRSVLAGG